MKNESFMLKKNEEKTESIVNLLKHKANYSLTQEQLRKLALAVRLDRQYEVNIYNDVTSFCEAVVAVISADRQDRCTVVFGKALPGWARDTGFTKAEVFDASQSAAIIMSRRYVSSADTKYHNSLHLLIPERIYAKGVYVGGKQKTKSSV